MIKNINVNELIKKILINNVDRFLLSRDILAYLRNNNVVIQPLALRHHIKKCRLSGMPIIADNRGYMLSTDSRDIKAYIDLRKIEIKSELKALRKMRKWL